MGLHVDFRGWVLVHEFGGENLHPSHSSLLFFFCFFLFVCLFVFFLSLGLYPQHIEVPRLGGLIGAVAADHSHSHSNVGSELCLRSIPQLRAAADS